MKYIKLVIFFFILSKNISAQSKKNLPTDTLIWNADYRLQVDDFEGRIKGKRAGETVSGIYLRTKEDEGTIKFVVEAVFVKSKSFLRDSSKYILEHEQMHFDITEVNARRLRKKISEKDFTRVKNISAVIKSLYEKANADWNREQNLFDSDTQHGLNPAKQKLWKDKVASVLKELEAFASLETHIRK
jgi:hypothetical protein